MMRNLKASEIIEAMEIFSEKCKKLDNMRDELLNMFASLLQRIKEEENTQNIEKKDVLCRREDAPSMSNPADICRECELASRNRELERRLSEMAIDRFIADFLKTLEVAALTEENRVLKLRVEEE